VETGWWCFGQDARREGSSRPRRSTHCDGDRAARRGSKDRGGSRRGPIRRTRVRLYDSLEPALVAGSGSQSRRLKQLPRASNAPPPSARTSGQRRPPQAESSFLRPAAPPRGAPNGGGGHSHEVGGVLGPPEGRTPRTQPFRVRGSQRRFLLTAAGGPSLTSTSKYGNPPTVLKRDPSNPAGSSGALRDDAAELEKLDGLVVSVSLDEIGGAAGAARERGRRAGAGGMARGPGKKNSRRRLGLWSAAREQTGGRPSRGANQVILRKVAGHARFSR